MAYAPKNNIIKCAFPRGVFLEGTMADTSKPGTCMQVKAATAYTNGRPSFVAAAPGTDGKPVMHAILLEDMEQGKTVDDAYVSGTRARLYVPAPGEEMLIRVGEVAGTGNTYAIGDRLIIDAEDGIYVPDSGSPADVAFVCQEVLTQVAGSTLCFAQKT